MDGFKVIEGGKSHNESHNEDGDLQKIPRFLSPGGDLLVQEDAATLLTNGDTAGSTPIATPGVGAITDNVSAATAREPSAIEPHQRRWAWAQIDREAISQNLKTLRKHIGPDSMILTVVKADGYGHGAVEVAKVAMRSGSKYLGVASVCEGIELRRAGIDAPIIILAEPPIDSIAEILHYDLVPALYTSEFALALGERADAAGCVAPYHLKIDSGMNRIGVHYSDAGDFLRSLAFHRGLELQGCFTHFATADTMDTLGLKMQQERFEQALETIRYMGMDPGIVHAANSAAAIRYKHTRYDMVRLGISVYGLHPSKLTKDLIKLRPAMSVRARVNSIKPVPLGEGVSYGFNYRSPGGVLIATIPIGYGDGLSRVLSDRIDILVDGYAYPQVGTICMDMCMFEVSQRQDISNIRQAQLSAARPSVEFGSEAIIIGRSGEQEISMDDIAEKMGTISYDLACMFGLRLERVYKN
ncbi:MAG: alanine racemase [Coriobacteriales bacterium]|nr:alanine racemase [Coriobacteriales bacterium]